ncbi:glycosyltransferase [Sphingomonas sp. HITSZ_GF]|uniref:glycosyltransferase n=1 Tax=Sphingomonas sp. HITSZ_GF TaxID=3037247 RepID=UPI00240D0D88|nr:glycosyltransferase [Sphingomonas sp. HITSZ_GF]MDG2535773.1 glycosyltransferase [Sphingomonas sp. HITSZ_GF]
MLTLDPEYGGPAEGVRRLVEAWRADGHVADVVTLDDPEAPYIRADNEGVFALGKRGGPDARTGPQPFLRRFSYSPLMVPWLRENRKRYDGVLVHSLWNYSTLAARRVLVGSDTPYFVFPHGSLDPWFRSAYPHKHFVKSFVWPFNEGVLMRNATAVMFTTEEERVLAQDIFLPYKVNPAIVGFGSRDAEGDPEQTVRAFRAAVPALGERPFLLFLSRIHAKKGCDLLIKAFAGIAAERPELDLVMAGPDQDGWQARLQDLAASLGIADRIHWTGMIEHDVKWGAFRACDAFALISHSENFGIVVAEALACERPVLITDKVNLWREVKEDGAALIGTDTQESADALLREFVALAPETRAAMGKAARRCFEQRFRIGAAAQTIVKTMQDYGAGK